jgi:DNA-binding CsgD family transcriptional regulator/tetratricopeptide (TPR) repeat protein
VVRSDQPKLLERDEPRALLEDALRAARTGSGRIVSLEGEAGIGKTALALSFAEAHRRDARVYIGGCEQLATPEPLGPLRDIARESSGRFSVSATSQLATFESLLRLLTSGRDPALLVTEDIHWADDPTLDVLRYLGRRIRGAPILVVTTFRNDEAPSQARLAALWADLPRDCRQRIELQRLSAAAISVLAAQSGRGAHDIFEATGGNPFHVTEFLASERASVPRSVRDATLARTSRLSSHARRTLDCASIFPRQIDEATVRVLAEDPNSAGVEECMRAGMLNAASGTLSFRHELARRAVHEAISPLRRRELHGAALELLKSREHVRAAEVAHHAQEAHAMRDLVTYSLRAADEAAALGAHREVVQHLARALEHGTWLTNAERADLLERQAEIGELCGAFELAVSAVEEAIAARKRAGDILGLGHALCVSARLQWHHGKPEIAEEQQQEALEVMRDHRDTWQYAMALSGQSQLDMLADRNDVAIPRAQEAEALAEKLGRSDIYMHALTNETAARCSTDVAAGTTLNLAAIAEARRRQQLDHLPRLYVNLVYMRTNDRRYAHVFEYLDEATKVATARDNAPLEAYIRGVRAIALIDVGRIPEGIAEAELVHYGPYPRGMARFPAATALARARIRTGVPEDGVLDDLRVMQTSQRDLMRRAPLAVVDAEALWLGLPRPGALERLRAAFDVAVRSQGQKWLLADTALWLKILGEPFEIPAEQMRRLQPAYRAHLIGTWNEAADAWRELGCPYEQAIALSMGDEPSQREALALFDSIGAAPAAARLRREMRARGARAVPRGPIAPTRASPAGLTRRQAQVLALVIEGLSNPEIARRLCISPKTTEHHVAAIMARLGAHTRQEAAEAARKRGLIPAPRT